MLRTKRPPEYIARGVMVGTLWAMTPTIGIQMGMVVITWFITTRFFNWNFSLLNGVAWTWTTNVITMIPFYYLFLITGQIILEHDSLSGFSEFQQLWHMTLNSDLSFFEVLSAWFSMLFFGWGLPMLVGCVPWCIISGILAYHLSYRFVVNYRKNRETKFASAAAQT